MGERFYPGVHSVLAATAVVLTLAACGPSEEPGPPSGQAAGPSSWFPRPEGLVASYQPPADGDLLPRLLLHLEKSSRDSLHFSLEQLPGQGERAADALVAGIEERILDKNKFASLHNYCKALAGCGGPEHAEVLVRVLRECSVPLARTGAAEALGAIGGPEHAAALIQVIELESEAGPLQAEYKALGQLGGPEAYQYLEDRVQAWAQNRPGAAIYGNLAWTQVLALEDEGAVARLERVAGLLSGRSFQVAALRRRAELGDFSVRAALRGFLDPATTPAPGTRIVALEGLGHAQDWEGVQLGFDDPDRQLHVSAINVLSLPAGRESRVAHARLEELAQGPDAELAQAAMHALCMRGDRRLLEPWLVRARAYPHGAGSVNAINLLKHEDAADPRTTPVLLQAWEQSDDESRIGLLRVFGRMQDPRCLPLIEELVHEGRDRGDLHRMALTQLSNLDEIGLPVLLRFLEQPVAQEDSAYALASLGGLAIDFEDARERLIELALDAAQPDWVRADSLGLLVKVLGVDAYPVLLEARDQTQRSEVRAFVDQILREFF